MWKKPEQTAWIILLLSFLTCVLLAIGTPLSIRWYALNSTRPLNIVLEARAGTVALQRGERGETVLVRAIEEVLPKSHIIGSTDDVDALLLFYLPENPEVPLTSLQIYGKTDLMIETARTPRFGYSPHPHRITLQVNRSPKAHATVSQQNERPTALEINAPHGIFNLDPGSYALTVSPEQSEIAVRAGQAQVYNPNSAERLTLEALERTRLTHDEISEITVGEHNILQSKNGDFNEGLQNWDVIKETGLENENAGLVRPSVLEDNRTILSLERVGQGHASTGITQDLSQDIRGAQSLRIQALIRIDLHLLPVCGSVGTECPLMLRLYYLDTQGYTHEWIQGFYIGELTDKDPSYCSVCEWEARHIRIPQGIWYDYESLDLIPLIKAKGIEPATLQSIQVYASGHTYASAIDKVAIFIGE
jgi:hypothetical protein